MQTTAEAEYFRKREAEERDNAADPICMSSDIHIGMAERYALLAAAADARLAERGVKGR